MEKQFVPYEWALKLKELDFNELCFGYYEHTGSLNIKINRESLCNKVKGLFCDAPLWQQAFDWFRKNHNLYGCPELVEKNLWSALVINTKTENVKLDKECNSYEEARLECLKKLIKIVENDNKHIR